MLCTETHVGSVTTSGKKQLCSLVVQLVRLQKCELTVAGVVAVFDNDLGSVQTTHHTDIIDAVLGSFIPSPISQFYPYPFILSAPLPLRTESQGVVVEISPYQMRQPFDPRVSSIDVDGVYVSSQTFLFYGAFRCGDFSCVCVAI